ncbi:BTAD domain-containing putative transcriptional regulator [Nonomuraea sp. H19]|uniref:BTAD domain-containing putative transcriptional regulator n=1 Tax=Nonomuraea sp. H19 TaxID=3452206 RepID=UPI003F8CE36C
MRFGVLGPLEVWTDEGKPVKVPEAKVRALLAILLAHRGRAVSADRLVDDLWGEHLPVNPTGTLQTKASQLRRALAEAEAGGRALVVSRRPGYLLDVDDDAVDAGRFQALLARAHASAVPQDRAALLNDALALWRGPAFEDMEFLRAAAAGLEEQRLVALEDLAEVRLALGEHGRLAAELADLVTEHPLRERLRAAHMRALYRSGRQVEALDSYRDLRERLADELGLDPGPELADLHRAILSQDADSARPQTNLPAPVNELIGRSEAVAEVRSLLTSSRLVTLTGPGGVGKTRLAMEVASGLFDGYADGVWLVDLTPLREPAIVDTIAAVLGIRDDGTYADSADRLASGIRARRLLLVLDNCEHLISAVAALAARLLRSAQDLRILATSQEPLAIAGERLWAVPPLELPDPDAADPRASSAVRLFAERAAPGFVLHDDNAHVVAEICRRLDGIPLALELAATRVRGLGVRELADRLGDRFRLLTSGRRDAPARQRTLRATIDWSWELLSEPERTVLRRLAVHAGGCTLAAAEAVCAGAGVRHGEVLDLLMRLVDRSLVVVADGRYRLLESVAEYCRERLVEAGEFDEVRRRHAVYYAELAERADLRGHDQRTWLERLDAESGNLRGALLLGDAVLALRLVNALGWYWYLRGRKAEALRSIGTALSAAGEAAPDLRAKARIWQAAMSSDVPAPGAAVLEDIADPGERARARWLLAYARFGIGDLAISEDLIDQAIPVFRALGDRWGIAAALNTRAMLATFRGDLAALESAAEQSMALFRELGDEWGRLKSIEGLADLAEITGDYERATCLHRDALRIAESLGLWGEVSMHLSGLGRLALLSGDHARADDLHSRAARLAVQQADTIAEEFADLGLALGARRQGRLDNAEQYLRKWLDWSRRLDADVSVALILTELGFVAELRGDAEAARELHLEGLAAARATNDPRAAAFAKEGLAGAESLAGRHEPAARLLGEAAAAREAAGAPLPDAERGDVDRITSRLLAAMGEPAFTAAFTATGRRDALRNPPLGEIVLKDERSRQ